MRGGSGAGNARRKRRGKCAAEAARKISAENARRTHRGCAGPGPAARFPGGGRPDAPARRLAAPPFDRVGDGRHVMDLSASSEQSRWGGRYPRAARRSGAVTQQVAVSDSGLGGPDLSESLRCESLPLHSGRTAGGGGQQAGAPLGGFGMLPGAARPAEPLRFAVLAGC